MKYDALIFLKGILSLKALLRTFKTQKIKFDHFDLWQNKQFSVYYEGLFTNLKTKIPKKIILKQQIS